jgi:myo-inositol-1(or 4)-monophosphatase
LSIAHRYAFLQRLSREAGAMALDFWRRRDELVVEMKGPQDFVSFADRAVEDMIRAAVGREFPDDAFLGEETSAGFEGSDDHLWIVDPIDGTHNFLRGIPYWNVSIAFVEHGVRTLGAICDPVAGDVFHAMRGHGAWRNDARLRTSTTAELPGAVVCVGHHDRWPDYRYLELRRAFMDRNIAFRNFGCAALQLAHVAEGRYDAYVELELSSWDAMAGLLLVEEAGGRAWPFPGPDGLRARSIVVASASGIAEPLFELVRSAASKAA